MEPGSHRDEATGKGKPGLAELMFVEPPSTRLPEDIECLFRPDMDYGARLAAARRLPDRLGDREIAGLFEYLRSSGPREGLVGMQERLLKSAVMDLLIKQSDALGAVADGLIAVYRDRTQDAVVREYALLYLSFCFDGAPADRCRAIRAVLRQATGETANRISATALLALKRLSDAHEMIARLDHPLGAR